MGDDTSAARRAALLAKREQLRAQQAEHMARQRQADDVARFERALGTTLADAGVAFDVLWQRDVPIGPLSRYPIGFASVRWDRVPEAMCLQGGSDEALREAFVDALGALAIAPDTRVIVDWCIGGQPRVALSATDAATHAVALMQQAADTWVYAEGAAWLIEIYHEGQVHYAAQPGAEDDAGDGWRRRTT